MLDGLFVAALRQELSDRLRAGRIASVQAVDRYTLVVAVRRQRQVETLLLSCDPELPRVHLLTGEPPARPAREAPPPFILLLRRHLESARIQAITQPGPGYDRILRFELDTRGPGGRSYPLWLIAELLGKKADLWLVDANTQQILDGWRHQRGLAAGSPYAPPPRQEKVELAPGCGERIVERYRWLAATRQGREQSTAAALAQLLDGIGPLTAAEIVGRAGLSTQQPVGALTPTQLQQLATQIEQIGTEVAAGQFAPTLLWSTAHPPAIGSASRSATAAAAVPPGPLDLCALALTQYPAEQRQLLGSPSAALERWATPRWEQAILTTRRHNLLRPVQAALRQAQRRLEKQEQELASAQRADQWRIFGELLLSHLATIPAGADQVIVDNYYAEPTAEIRIPLDPSLSPAQNAQRYFHRYTRARRTQQAATDQVRRTRRHIHYLEGVWAELEWATSPAELDEIEVELAQSDLLPARTAQGRASASARAPLPPRRFVTTDQIEVWVGRNNRQNDRLSLKQAAPQDLWFHAHQIPGAHVILRCGNLPQVPDSSLAAAAQVAAYYSRGASSSHVPVDYTLCKNLRKPKGTAPGYVIYHTYKTVQVVPSLAAVQPGSVSEPRR